MLLLNPRRTRTNMKLLQLVWIFLLTLCGQSGVTAMKVKEDDDVILDCSFGTTNIENKKFDWKKDEDTKKMDVFLYADKNPQPGSEFRGRVSYFPDQLQFGNASIKITKAETTDSGTYTCYYIPDVRTPQPEIRSIITLTVGAAPRPIVTVDKTKDEVLLTCEVRGAFPKPEVEWWDSDGNVLAVGDPQIRDGKGNKYDTVLNVTVNKAGFYRCVATQKEIYHQIYTKTYAPGPGAASEPSVTNLGGTKDGVLLQCVVRGASPELKVFWTDKAGHNVPSKEEKTENSIILQTTVTKTDYYRCVTTEGKKDDKVYSETHVVVPDGASNIFVIGVIGIVVGVIGIVAIVAAVVVVLYVWKQRFRGPTTEQKNQSEEDPLNSAAGQSQQPR